MSKFFIHRPVFAIVISIIIVMIGIIAALQLPIAQYPQFLVLNETVAQIIEQQVNGTQGMDYMQSNSDDSGRYVMRVVFDSQGFKRNGVLSMTSPKGTYYRAFNAHLTQSR